MNPVDDKEGMPQDGMLMDSTLSPAQDTDGFAAIMKRLKGRSAQERAALKTQADHAVLGYEAYALGHEYLERGDLDAAGRWLRVAAGHHVPGAEQALAELAEQSALNDVVTLATVPAAVLVEATSHPTATRRPSGLCAADGSHPGKNDGLWAAAVANLHAVRQTAAARTSAEQIIERARREADELLAQAQRQAQTIVDDARDEAERIREVAHRQAVEEKKKEKEATSGAAALVRYPSLTPLYVTRVTGNLLTSTSDDLPWSKAEMQGLETVWSHPFRKCLHQALSTGFTTAQPSHELTPTYRDLWAAQNLAAVRERLHTALQTHCYRDRAFKLALQVLPPAPAESGGCTASDLVLLPTGCRGKSLRADSGADALLLWPALAHLLRNEEAFDRPDLLLRAVTAHAANAALRYALMDKDEGSGAAATALHAGVREVV
ncbi:DivIVA domain-containing protein [Streptomyces sp. NPDC057621]|uniref:DivIVA domain-containing protein n=1 Tax=Streptomyces sp. NPDC057621 TaxID=3346186 RepID=UPI0036CE4ED9